MDHLSGSRPAPQRTKPRSFRLAVLAAVVVLAADRAAAQLPVAELKTIFPPGGQRGTTVDVQITGTDLDGPTTLLFSHPGISATPKMEEPGPLVRTPRAIDNQFAVAIAADTPPGIYEVRAVGRFGASNPRAFVVGALDEMTYGGANPQPSGEGRGRRRRGEGGGGAITAPPAGVRDLPLDVVANATVGGDSVDRYQLNLKQGERVLIECWARRIDSRMEPALVLWDGKGAELLRDRGAETRDALLDFTAPADGAYTLGVYDFLYRGGNEYFYRLRAHTGPQVEMVFPPVAQPGQPAKLAVYGRNLPGSQLADDVRLDGRPLEKVEVEVNLPADSAAQRQLAVSGYVPPNAAALDTFAYQFATPQGAADPVAIAFAQAPVVVEQEPNDQPGQVNKVTAPCEYVGRFYPDGDRDWVEFDAKRGDVYWIEVIAHRLGQDSDPFLIVQRVKKNDQGEEQVNELAQVDDPNERNNRIGGEFDTSTDDPSWRLEANEDATYRILVRDQFGNRRLDPRCVYRLVIRREQPDFRLAVLPESSPAQNDNQIPQYATVLRRGGTAFVQVRVERRDGFTGEIEVAAEGLPPGVSCVGAVLGGNVKEGVLMFTAAEDAPAGSSPLTVVGKARIGDEEVIRQARPGALVWGTNNRQQERVRARMARDLVLSVIDKETGPALVKIGDGGVVETSKGGKVEIPVSVAWRGEFKGDLQLAPVGAPNDFQVKNFNVKPGQGDAKVEFTLSNNNIQPGAYTFYLRGQSRLSYERNPDLIKDYEDRQKEAGELVAQMQEQAKQAAEAKTKATQAAQEAANQVKQKEQAVQSAKPEEAEQATQALAQAREQLQAAEQAKTQAEEADRKAQDLVRQATERKQQIDNRLNEVKQANQKKEINVFLASTPIKLRVAPDPVEASAAASPTLKQGEKAEVTVTVNRLYGFDDQVEVTFEPPGGVNGLSAPKITIPKGQTEGKLEVTAANNATVGEHRVNLRFRVRFNNVQLDEQIALPVKVEMAEAK